MNLSTKLHRPIVKSVTIRGQPLCKTCIYIYIYIEEGLVQFPSQGTGGEKRVPERERERTPRGGTLTLDNPPLHGPPTPLRNCVRARYQLAESNLVFREGWDDWFTENEWPHCQTSLCNLGIRLPRREREGETLDFDDSRLDWIVSNRFRSSFRGFLIFRY